jgi:hypothetical protein
VADGSEAGRNDCPTNFSVFGLQSTLVGCHYKFSAETAREPIGDGAINQLHRQSDSADN